MSKVAVVGIGNLLMQDDGVGVHVIQELEAMHCLPEDVVLIDAGVNSYDMVDVFCSYDHLIIVDAMEAGGKPGTLYRAPLDDLGLRPNPNITSLHEMHFVEAVNMIKLMGYNPEVVVIGIEPEVVQMNMDLSPVIQAKVSRIIELVQEEVAKIVTA